MTEIELDDVGTNIIRVRDPSGNVHEFDLDEELMIHDYDLNKDISEQASKYQYWNSVLTNMLARQEAQNNKVEYTYSALYEPARQYLVESGVSKPTKDQINSQIILQQSYQDELENLKDINAITGKVKGIVKAFEQRKDMLVQKASTDRKEREYEQAIRNG